MLHILLSEFQNHLIFVNICSMCDRSKQKAALWDSDALRTSTLYVCVVINYFLDFSHMMTYLSATWCPLKFHRNVCADFHATSTSTSSLPVPVLSSVVILSSHLTQMSQWHLTACTKTKCSGEIAQPQQSNKTKLHIIDMILIESSNTCKYLASLLYCTLGWALAILSSSCCIFGSSTAALSTFFSFGGFSKKNRSSWHSAVSIFIRLSYNKQ